LPDASDLKKERNRCCADDKQKTCYQIVTKSREKILECIEAKKIKINSLLSDFHLHYKLECSLKIGQDVGKIFSVRYWRLKYLVRQRDFIIKVRGFSNFIYMLLKTGNKRVSVMRFTYINEAHY
jgi:hypothetical protein